MDVAKFLSDLYSELEQIEREIQVLGLFEAGIRGRLGVGLGLSAAELASFRRNNATEKRGHDRMCCPD